MSYDRRHSSSVVAGTRVPSGGSLHVSYDRLSPLQAEAHRHPHASFSADSQALENEIKRLRGQLERFKRDNQRLEDLAQQQRQELLATMETMEGIQSTLTRTLRQLHQIAHQSSSSPSGSETIFETGKGHTPSVRETIGVIEANGHSRSANRVGQSGPVHSYEFLNRLKHRRTEDRTPALNGSSPGSASATMHQSLSGDPPYVSKVQATADPSSPSAASPSWEPLPPPFPAPPTGAASLRSPQTFLQGQDQDHYSDHRPRARQTQPQGNSRSQSRSQQNPRQEYFPDPHPQRPWEHNVMSPGRTSRSRKGSSPSRSRNSSSYGQPAPRSYGPGEGSLSSLGELADADLLEHLGLDPQDSSYLNTLSQKEREKQQSSSVILWIAVALLLVVGSFGAGFLVVQPFIRDAEVPTEPFPR